MHLEEARGTAREIDRQLIWIIDNVRDFVGVTRRSPAPIKGIVMAEWPLRGQDVAGDLLHIISCLYACVFGSASVCLSVHCE